MAKVVYKPRYDLPAVGSTWFARWNGVEHRVYKAIGGDVFVERLDGTDRRMLMVEKFWRYFAAHALPGNEV